jgi:hypothetical protein
MKVTFVLLALAPSLFAIELKPGNDGIHVNAGALGGFSFSYPTLTTQSNTELKLIEARPAGANASLKYTGGTEIEVTTSSDGTVTCVFSGLPADVKSLTTGTLIDISFGRGGKWKSGDNEGVFPRGKATPPHFLSANGNHVTISNPAGDTLDLTIPDYSFIQLTDNREWSMNAYSLKTFINVNSSTKSIKLKLAVTKGSGETKVLDPFGQVIAENWPEKIQSEDELKADAKSEAAYYASFNPPTFDTYGGLPGSGARLGLKKTGFFHIHNAGGKSYLVDPEGNLHFHLGICGFQPSDDYTYIKGRENIYAWLPKADDPTFATAFRKDDPTAFSYYVSNSIRKYGQPYDHEVFANRMIDRVRKFGFNSIGAFSGIPSAAKEKNFPYVLSLPLNKWDSGIKTIPGAHEVWDPFDEGTRSIIGKTLAEKLPARANDPLLIGYFVVNEPRYDELPKLIPSLNADQACKRAFVDFLKAKYKDIAAWNTAWSADASSFDELAPKGLAVTTEAAKADSKAFTGVFLDKLFSLVESNFRKADKNHLLIGYRYQPITIKDQQLCEITGKYVDINSYNYYTHELDKEHLRQIHQWTGGKPIMLSEFYWTAATESGLSGGGNEVGTQQNRGLIYRNYVEQAASLGFVVGIEWFTLIDQAATGRWFSQYNGESSNSGLFNVADRPWKPMIAEMVKTNHTIYDVVLGKRPPFVWEQAKVLQQQRK